MSIAHINVQRVASDHRNGRNMPPIVIPEVVSMSIVREEHTFIRHWQWHMRLEHQTIRDKQSTEREQRNST